ncbi:10313_t:CDS:1, partial [Cetraspora pellucida]
NNMFLEVALQVKNRIPIIQESNNDDTGLIDQLNDNQIDQ